MAQLKDTIVTGDLSVTGSIYGNVPVDDLSGYTGTAGFLKKENDSWSLSAVTIPDATSVKGNAETTYRTGQVNLTPANLGISATTTSVTVGSTTFNKYTHPTGAGNNHIPSGGSSGQFLGWSSAGTAAWVANPNTDTKVTQAAAMTTAGEYPVLLAYSTATTAVTNTVNKTGNLLYNPNTGVMTLGNGTTTTLYSKTPSRTSSFIIVGGGKKTAGDANGTALRVGAGGLTLVGGGEYATNRYNVGDLTDGTEALYLGADTAVYIESNAQTTTDRKTFTFAADGSLTAPNGFIGNLTGNATNVTGTVAIANGGTGATAKKAAKINLGITYGTADPSGGADGDIYVQYNTSSAHPFLDLVYPVGSIYLSVSSTSPATLFGGTWARIKDQFLLAAGDTYTNGEYGGEATHTLTTAEMPSHTHGRGTMEIVGTWTINDDSDNAGLDAPSTGTGAITAKNGSGYGSSVGGSGWGVNRGFTFRASDNWTGATSAVGSGQAHNNMPPYLAVYMWKRTA